LETVTSGSAGGCRATRAIGSTLPTQRFAARVCNHFLEGHPYGLPRLALQKVTLRALAQTKAAVVALALRQKQERRAAGCRSARALQNPRRAEGTTACRCDRSGPPAWMPHRHGTGRRVSQAAAAAHHPQAVFLPVSARELYQSDDATRG